MSVRVLISLFAALLMHEGASAQVDGASKPIVERYAEARGGREAMARITSLTYLAFPRQDVFGPKRTMIKARQPAAPGRNYFLVGCLQPDCGFAEGIDGKGAWEASPRAGRLRRVEGAAASALANAAAFYDVLLEPEARGATVTFGGETQFLGRATWKFDYALPGRTGEAYVDRVTNLLFAEKTAVKLHARGEPIPQVTLFSDWRPVAGVLFPFNVETFDWRPGLELQPLEAGGRSGWDAIIAGFDYPGSYFTPAAVQVTPAAQLVLDMYDAAARESADALVARYRRFKESPQYSGEVEDQLNWLGYELLKADKVELGIAVMDLLVAEFPTANAYDSLGDALLQGGRKADAARAFRQALALDPKFEHSALKSKKLGN